MIPNLMECADVSEVLGDAPLRWAELENERVSVSEKDRELWLSALQEVERGWLMAPTPVSPEIRKSCVPVKRFGLIQADKLRPCDDCKKSFPIKNNQIDVNDW